MNNDNIFEFCSIYNVIFIVNNANIKKISRTIVCPTNLNKIEIEQMVLEKFARVLSVEHVSKFGEGLRLRYGKSDVAVNSRSEQIRIETYWHDVEVSELSYVNKKNEIVYFESFLVSRVECEKIRLVNEIKKNSNEIKAIVKIFDCLDALCLKK